MPPPKINSYKEFDNEKNSCSSKIPTPPPPHPHNVRPLISCFRMFVPFQDSGPACSKDQLHCTIHQINHFPYQWISIRAKLIMCYPVDSDLP